MRSARSGGRLAVAAAALASMALAGCTSTYTSASSKNVEPKVAAPSKVSDLRLPTGWARYSYKALSVAAPAGWHIWPHAPLCAWPAHTVSEFTADNPDELVAACANTSWYPPVTQSIAIECLTGKADHLFSGKGPTTLVDWKVFHHLSPSSVYLQGDGWQAAVTTSATAQKSFIEKVLASVEPTGRPC